MSQEFIDQNYLIIESNVVTNVVVWNGDTNIWTPPQGSLALVQATTPALIWKANYTTTPYSWELGQTVGAGAIEFIWDGTNAVTNEPKPTDPPKLEDAAPNQPVTSGTVTA